MRIVDLLCRRPALLWWPIFSHPTPTIQKDFPLLSGQVVDMAVWDTQNYWLVRVLAEDATDSAFECAVFECVSFKAAFGAELHGRPEALIVPVLFVARDIQEPLLDWAFELGVFVRCANLEGGLYE